MQTIRITIEDTALPGLATMLGVPMADDKNLGPAMRRYANLSMFTTMPRSLKVFGRQAPTYQNWLGERINHTKLKALIDPAKMSVMELEQILVRVLRKEKSRRTPRQTYDCFIENHREATDINIRDHGTASIDQWMRKRFGFNDIPASRVRIERHDGFVALLITYRTKQNLDGYIDNVRVWLTSRNTPGTVVCLP